jgi:hypothetical protein
MGFGRQALEKGCKHMTSITAFPEESAVDRKRQSANPLKNGPKVSTESEIDGDGNRNRTNFFAAVVVVLLIAAGWWLVNSLVEADRVQGCYSSGTRSCSLI